MSLDVLRQFVNEICILDVVLWILLYKILSCLNSKIWGSTNPKKSQPQPWHSSNNCSLFFSYTSWGRSSFQVSLQLNSHFMSISHSILSWWTNCPKKQISRSLSTTHKSRLIKINSMNEFYSYPIFYYWLNFAVHTWKENGFLHLVINKSV